MKKMNKKVMVLGGLVMAVVLTGYSVVGTYAKYTETKSITDQATVAKWDVTLEANAKPLFNTSNNNALVSNRVAPGGSDSSEWKFVGTKGNTEVKVKFTSSSSISSTVKLEISKAEYDKLVAAGLTAVTYSPADGEYYYTPVLFQINGGTKTNLMAAPEVNTTDGFTISWSWAFEADKTAMTVPAEITETADIENFKKEVAILVDELDTRLGKLADDEKKVVVTGSITAVQEAMDRAEVEVIPASAENIQLISEAFGYDAEYTKNVAFSGNKLTGTINYNPEAKTGKLAEVFPAEAARDEKVYFYPIVVEYKAGSTYTITNPSADVTPKTYDATKNTENDSRIHLVVITESKKNEGIKIEMNGGTTIIDLSELNFD